MPLSHLLYNVIIFCLDKPKILNNILSYIYVTRALKQSIWY